MSGLFDTQDDLAEWENMEDGVAPADAETEPAAAEEMPTEETEETAPAETPAPEEASEAEPEAEPEPAPDPAALQTQIENLEKRLADKDEFNGRLSNELGELRAQQQQMWEQTQRSQGPDWETLLDENPAAAYQQARAARDLHRTQQAKQAWDDLSPGAPELFEQNQFLYGKLTELEQRFTATTAPLQQQHASQQIAGVYAAIKQQYEDFDQHEGAMQTIIETRPLMKAAFEKAVVEGTAEEQFAYLDDLYRLASGRKADTLREAATQVARDHAAETLRAKQEAQVASASASIDTDRPTTPADVIGAEFEEFERSRSDGWKINS